MLEILEWEILTSVQKKNALLRPALNMNDTLREKVASIIAAVKIDKDMALYAFTKQFDHVDIDSLRVSEKEIEDAQYQVSEEKFQAILFAYNQILQFHQAQFNHKTEGEISAGVYCSRQSRPIEKVGLYIPAGEVPLPSTVLMLAIPAKIAGCSSISICTPPRRDGSVDPLTVAAKLCGVHEIFKVGGAQAIAAMAYGTQSINKVAKIFGPGNAWVTAAKLAVMHDVNGPSCDLPAGPSELVVIADREANAKFIAADLLSQAEHSVDAQVILMTDSRELAKSVLTSVKEQITRLKRKSIIEQYFCSQK